MNRPWTPCFLRISALLALSGALLAGPAGCDEDKVAGGAPLLPPIPPANSAVEDAAEWLAGNYSSAAQAEQDPAYFDVRLHIVRIWPDRQDGPWLYVEQAMATSLDTPYRQRVYHVVDAAGGAAESIVFELPGDPLTWAGAWAEPTRFNALDPTLLVPRVGCSVTLRRTGPQEMAGSTEGDGCGSNLRGASHATSFVTVSPTLLLSWDRGYDKAGKQVWGATKGPYRFAKESPAAQVPAAEPPRTDLDPERGTQP